MKHLILLMVLLFTCVSYAESTSYDTDVTTEKAVFDCDQDLNVTYYVTYEAISVVPTHVLHTVFTFIFDAPSHNYGVSCMNGIESVPCELHKRARDNC